MSGTAVTFKQVSKVYGDTRALDSFSLDIAPGEFVTLLGASGSGKSTALSILAGFAEASSGDVRIGERSIIGIPSEDRNVGMVFQNFALFPHMTVFENVAFPLRMRRVSSQEIGKRVTAALEMVQLASFAKRRPAALSGGQRQRVALARAVVFEPPVLLMDECLSAFDLKLREELQVEIRKIHDDIGATTIFVTHDQGEALTMSDRVAVLHKGRIVQIDSPDALYDRPVSKFVADFIGRTNLMKAERSGSRLTVPGIDATFEAAPEAQWISIRPERLLRVAGSTNPDDTIHFTAHLERSVFQGAQVEHQLRLAGGMPLTMREGRSGSFIPLAAGNDIQLAFRRSDAVALSDN